MTYFVSDTQYSKKYDNMWKWYPNGEKSKSMICPMFALLTARNFFINKRTDYQIHETNIIEGINMTMTNNITNELCFTDLECFASIDIKKIMCTTVDLIKENRDMYYETMFKKIEYNTAIIFLKNAKYFVVLIKKLDDGGFEYCIRDCHEMFQYTFFELDDLIEHLTKIYNFEKLLDIGGVEFSDYSSIEFLRVTESYPVTIYDHM